MKKKTRPGIYRRLLHYVKPYTGRLLVAVICMIFFSAFHAAIALVVKFVLQNSFSSGKSSFFNLVYLSVICTFASRGLFDFGQEYLMNYVGNKSVTDIRDDLYNHIQGLSLDFFTAKRTGALMSRITNDVRFVQGSISSAVPDLVKQPLSILFIVGIMFYWDPFLALVTLVFFPLCALPIVKFGLRVRGSSRDVQSEMADLTSVMHEGLTGIRIVKAFSMEDYERKKFAQINHKIFRYMMKIVKNSAIVRPIIEIMAAFGLSLALWYAVNRLDQATFFGFMTAMFLLYEPVKKLSKVNNTIQQGVAAGQRIFNILDTKSTIHERPNAVEIDEFKDMNFHDIHFCYGGTDVQALNGVDFSMKKGEIVALVGPSGGGKTTLMNLIPRFYDPVCGEIKIDGVDIRDIKLKSLRGMIGMVTQDTILFNDTIRNNIAYGTENISFDDVIAAAKAANAHAFIESMTEGYDATIGEKGVKLSGGQRQRLAIARAILKNPQLLLLDEATSALDTESERLVQDAINKLMENRTSLVVAHRLSTIIHAHRIYVIEKGEIVESGSHQELLKNGSTYKRLYDMQFREDIVRS